MSCVWMSQKVHSGDGCVLFFSVTYFPKEYLVLLRKYYNLKDIEGDLAFAQLI